MGKEVLIKEQLSALAEGSAIILKKYIDSFPDMQGFASVDKSEIQRFTAGYYLCASALTKDFDRVCTLSSEVSSLISEATASADEEALAKALEVFERIIDLTRAYESFLRDSESIVSGKKQDFSYSALYRTTLVLYAQLSSF